MPVALYLVTERSDHLAVTGIAALAHIDVSTGLLERRIGTHPLHFLDRVIHPEQRSDLHDAADRHRDEGPDRKQVDVLFQLLVLGSETHGDLSYSAGSGDAEPAMGRSLSGS